MKMPFKVWTNNDFTGYYPVGTAAVVVAKTQKRAATLLNVELADKGLTADAKVEDMVEVPINKEYVDILHDGDV